MNFAVVVPMANEQENFHPFVSSLIEVLNMLKSGKVYFVVDNVSKDNTLELCKSLSTTDSRFINGGSICESNWKRTFLSKFGTLLSDLIGLLLQVFLKKQFIIHVLSCSIISCFG